MHYLCLVIQNDPALARAANRRLEGYGLKAYHVTTIASAISVINRWRFDVAMLDADGFGDKVPQMLEALRATHVPILVSSTATEESAEIEQLEHGATAILANASSPRLTALSLRNLAECREKSSNPPAEALRLGPLHLDRRGAQAFIGHKKLALTARQFEVLVLLATRSGEFVHRHEIALALRHGGDGVGRSIDMYICRLRQKLRDAGDVGLTIDTVYGRGYCLTYVDPEQTAAQEAAPWCLAPA